MWFISHPRITESILIGILVFIFSGVFFGCASIHTQDHLKTNLLNCMEPPCPQDGYYLDCMQEQDDCMEKELNSYYERQ